jgi:hypothetical protein
MLAQRRNNELDSFIAHHATHHNSNPTLRMHSPNNAHKYHANANAPLDRNDRTISPNRISNTRKPMLNATPTAPSPVLSRPRPKAGREQCCANENHRSKRA